MNELLKEEVKTLIIKLFDGDVTDYDDVDDFYAHLGYDLELKHLLMEFNIQGTSDLHEFLEQDFFGKNRKMSGVSQWDSLK